MKKAKSLLSKYKVNLVHALLMAFSFAIIGATTPYLYYEYLDTRVHFSVSNPIVLEESSYNAGDRVGMVFNLQSNLDMLGEVTASLIAVDGDIYRTRPLFVNGNQTYRVTISRTDGYFPLIVEDIVLPDDAKPGAYLISFIMKYEVKGSEREYFFTTETFDII